MSLHEFQPNLLQWLCESVWTLSVTISVLVDRTGISFSWSILQVMGIHFLVAINWRSLNIQSQSLSKLIVHTIHLLEAYPSLSLTCKTLSYPLLLLLYNKRVLLCAISVKATCIHANMWAPLVLKTSLSLYWHVPFITRYCTYKIMLVTRRVKITYQQKSPVWLSSAL